MKNQCQRYEKAITHFVTGEDMGMSKEELFEHLKSCKNCRRDLTEWQDTVTVMRTEAFSKTPEGQAKMHSDLAKLKERMKTGLPPVVREEITTEKIGLTAGEVWRFLDKHGSTSLPVLPEKINRDPYLTILSTGWLAKENKVRIDATKQPPIVTNV